MRKDLFVFFVVVLVSFNSCSEDEATIDSIESIATDIYISTSDDVISWYKYDDLMQKLERALSYNFGSSNESEIDIQQNFNVDTTQVIVDIAFRAEHQARYSDSNLSNNSVAINLERIQGVTLQADGPGNTYELITSILAPGQDPIEAPDCSHSDFGEHIDEIFDDELEANVFRFHLHTIPDDDRCIRFDRQRNEIKSYDKSPNNLLGKEYERVNYKWKFKLAAGFRASSRFTQLHQLKSVGGPFSSHPMYTLTARKGTPDELELRYGKTDSSVRVERVELATFLDTWVEVNETITYGIEGTYDIEIKRFSDGVTLLSYSNPSIVNWRPDADFVRPKWGIYRSIENIEDLRDEEVLFADFVVTEIESMR